MRKQKTNDNPWRAVAMLGGVGVDLGVCMIGGYWLGSWFSRSQGGEPIWIVAGMMLGFLVGVASIILIIKSYMKGNNNG